MTLPKMENSGRGSLKHFYKLAEKKPELKMLLTNINDITSEQIEKSKLPKWVRDLLAREKETADRRAAGFLDPADIAAHMSAAHVDHGVEIWSVYKLTSNIKIGVKFQIEAEEGDLVALTNDSVVVNSINKTVTKDNLINILDNSINVGDMSPEEYREQVRSYIDGKF